MESIFNPKLQVFDIEAKVEFIEERIEKELRIELRTTKKDYLSYMK